MKLVKAVIEALRDWRKPPPISGRVVPSQPWGRYHEVPECSKCGSLMSRDDDFKQVVGNSFEYGSVKSLNIVRVMLFKCKVQSK